MNLHEASSLIWESIRDWYDNAIGLATLNLLWVAISLTVVLMPPATAGMVAVTNSVAHGTGQSWEIFWQNARRYGWLSVRWALLNLFAIVLIVVNFSYYGTTNSTLSTIIQIIVAASGLLWFATQFYFWPFLIEQDRKSVRVGLKNALFLALAEPLFTVMLLSTAGVVILFSIVTVVPLAVVTLSFVSLLANHAVIERLTAYGIISDSPSTDGDRPL